SKPFTKACSGFLFSKELTWAIAIGFFIEYVVLAVISGFFLLLKLQKEYNIGRINDRSLSILKKQILHK
ncbi:hypothetical protein Q4524_20080, partial [Alteromonas stellipolaris]|uniref:hypothetical protein n=1 Tax=Alteromonas stellipolaris TaxID=233316 RepID=UPI0026E355B6